MKAQDLKKSILQYAMEGKLVAQEPSDEPASELLKRIKAEKEQLIKDGKIKKEKPLPPITQDEIPYELPQGWEWVRLQDIVYNHGQKTPQTTFCYIDIGSINNKQQKLNKNENIVLKENAPSRARKIVKYGDILYATVRPYLHNMCIIDQEFSYEPIASTGFAVLHCYTHIHNKWLFYYLLAPIFDNYANSSDNAKGMAYPAINDNKLYKALIPIPPLAEQKRIVEKLEEILPLVEEYGKNEEILSEMNQKLPKQIRQSILQYAVQGKLVEQDPTEEPASELLKRIKAEKEQLIKEGKIKKEKPLPPITQDEIPYDLPQGWEWCYLNDITTQIHYGYTASAIQRGNVKLVRITDIQNNQIKWDSVPYCDISEENKNKYLLQNNDILIARTGGTIGKTYLVKKIDELAVFASYLIRAIPSIYVDSKYIKLFMDSPLYWEQLKNFSMGTGQPNVNGQSLNKLKIPLPPQTEQEQIVTKVEKLMQLVDKLENKET